MFARTAAVFVLALPLLAAATVLPRGGKPGKPGKPSNPTQSTPSVSECNSGSVQCCNSAQESSSSGVAEILGLFGIDSGTVTGQVGFACSGVDSATSCSSQSVCCNGNSFSGAVVIGCSPINVNA